MITVNAHEGTMDFEGTKADLMAEITWLIRELLKEDQIKKEDILYCVDLAQKPLKDLAEDTEQKMSRVFLAALLGDKEAMKIIDDFMDFTEKLLKEKEKKNGKDNS